MRIDFLAPSLARLMPGHHAVFLATGLAREILLALTGPRNYDDAEPDYSRSARSRLLRVLVDELSEAREQPLHLPEPRDDRLQAIARALHEGPADSTASPASTVTGRDCDGCSAVVPNPSGTLGNRFDERHIHDDQD
jgi:hypothetical protein